MQQTQVRAWLQLGVVATAVIAAIGLAGTRAFTRGNHDEAGEELREAIEGGRARNGSRTGRFIQSRYVIVCLRGPDTLVRACPRHAISRKFSTS